MGFPIPSTTPISSASFASITVNYVTGLNPNDPHSCGRFPGATGGNTIDVFQLAKNSSGATVACSGYGYSTIIAHELGHFYGLGHVPGGPDGCTSIMAPADGYFHTVTGDDCAAARESVETPSENNSVNGYCQEPCAGSCTTDGFCEATNTPTSPIVVALSGNRFDLSGLEDPVLFDLDNDGQLELSGWTARDGGTAFLALDRNGNCVIDDGGELFGNHTLLPDGSVAVNGYVALSPYDSPALGGDGDLEITPGDAIWPSLCLWLDRDHDGLTDPGELRPLASHGITAISLEYRLDRRVDGFGNRFWYRGSATRTTKNGNASHPILVYDVYFIGE